jgi:hypothetical protein
MEPTAEWPRMGCGERLRWNHGNWRFLEQETSGNIIFTVYHLPMPLFVAPSGQMDVKWLVDA